jgi:hypothetical protein
MKVFSFLFGWLFKKRKTKNDKIDNKTKMYRDNKDTNLVKESKNDNQIHKSNSEEIDLIKNITVRKLKTHEDNYLKKKIDEFNIKNINKSNYKNYCFGNRKYKNKVFSIISLYRITNGKRSDFKYVLIFMHTKNTEPNAKMKLLYSLYIDFNDYKYTGNYYKLFKKEEFINKIWKKVEKLYDEHLYNSKNKKRRN